MAIKVSKAKDRSSTPYPRVPVTDMQNPLSLVWPIDHWLQWQAELLKLAAPSLNGFLSRRGEALSAAMRTAEKLVACRDLDAALSIQSEWAEGALKRLELDIEAAAEHAIALSHCAADATRRAAQTTSEVATSGMERVLRVGEPAIARSEPDAAMTDPPALVRSPAAEPAAAPRAAA